MLLGELFTFHHVPNAGCLVKPQYRFDLYKGSGGCWWCGYIILSLSSENVYIPVRSERVNCRHLSSETMLSKRLKGNAWGIQKPQQIPCRAVSGPFDGKTGTLHLSRELSSLVNLHNSMSSLRHNQIIPYLLLLRGQTIMDAEVSSKQVHPEGSGSFRNRVGHDYWRSICFKWSLQVAS